MVNLTCKSRDLSPFLSSADSSVPLPVQLQMHQSTHNDAKHLQNFKISKLPTSSPNASIFFSKIRHTDSNNLPFPSNFPPTQSHPPIPTSSRPISPSHHLTYSASRFLLLLSTIPPCLPLLSSAQLPPSGEPPLTQFSHHQINRPLRSIKHHKFCWERKSWQGKAPLH